MVRAEELAVDVCVTACVVLCVVVSVEGLLEVIIDVDSSGVVEIAVRISATVQDSSTFKVVE